MIVALVGPMGTGKTCTATAVSYTEHVKNGKKVLANYHLNFPYTLFSPAWLLAHMTNPEEISNCVMIWDEGMQGLDSSVRSKFSRLALYFVAQTRKRDVDLYVCCHALDELDKRLRRKIDVCGTCSGVEEEPCKGCDGVNPDNPDRGSGFTKSSKGICPKCAGTGHAESTVEI